MPTRDKHTSPPLPAGAGEQEDAKLTSATIRLDLDFRACGKTSGETRFYVWSETQLKVLEPARTQRSKTGNHGTDTYFLLPDHRYAYAVREISNSGQHHCRGGSIVLTTEYGKGYAHLVDGKYPLALGEIACPTCLNPPAPEEVAE